MSERLGPSPEAMGISGPKKLPDFVAPQELHDATIRPFTKAEMEKVTPEETLGLVREYQSLSFMMAHLDSYADTSEGKQKVKEYVDYTLKDIKKLRETVVKDVSNPDLKAVGAFRDQFLGYLGKYLPYSRAVLEIHLLPSKKWKGGKVPGSFAGLLGSYLRLQSK